MMDRNLFLFAFVLLNVASVAMVYRRGVATGTPRGIAFYTAMMLGPLALPLLLGTRRKISSDPYSRGG